MPDDLFITHADGIQILLTEHGAKLLIQSARKATIEGDAVKLAIENVGMVHLSLEHLKLFTILAHRQLAEWEGKNEPILLSKETVTNRKIDLKAEW